MTAQRWPEDLGSVAEEAGRLLESLRRSAGDPGPSAPGHDPAAGPHGTAGPSPETADGAAPRPGSGFTCDDPVCQWCPVCRASGFIRRLSPETLSGLAEFAGFAATVLADLAAARERADRPEAGPDE